MTMSNREFLQHFIYEERVMRELHGVAAAKKEKALLEKAEELVALSEAKAAKGNSNVCDSTR